MSIRRVTGPRRGLLESCTTPEALALCLLEMDWYSDLCYDQNVASVGVCDFLCLGKF